MGNSRKNQKCVFIFVVSLIVIIIFISSITLYEFFYIPPYKTKVVPENVQFVVNEFVMQYGLADRRTDICCYPLTIRSATEILGGAQSHLTLITEGAVAVSS